MNSACNCCEEPPCAEPVLEYVSALGVFCGFTPGSETTFVTWADDVWQTVGLPAVEFRKVYTSVVITKSVSLTEPADSGNYGGGSATYVTTYTKSIQEGVCISGPVTGSGSWNYSFTQGYGEEGPPEGDHYTGFTESGSGSGILTPGNRSPGSTITTSTYSESESSTVTSGASYFAFLGGIVSQQWSGSSYVITFENGSVTIAFTGSPDPAFPAYPAFYGESEDALLPGQSYSGLAQKSGITLRKIKWRVRHLPTGSCYLKVWIRKTFTPAATDPPTVPPPAPTVTEETYEWTGTGNPCLTAPTDPADADSQKITGTENEVGVPDQPGTTTVEILKYSCLPGYTPDVSDPENPQPSGYPNPAWEAAAP